MRVRRLLWRGMDQAMFGTVKVGVSTVWKHPVSLVKPRSSLGLSLTSWSTSDSPSPCQIVGNVTDGSVQGDKFQRLLGRSEELLAVSSDLQRT